MARETSRYFPSKKLRTTSEKPEHIQLDEEALITDIVDQIKDYFGRAKDDDVRDLCSIFAGGMPNKRQTRMQRMFESTLKEVRSYK